MKSRYILVGLLVLILNFFLPRMMPGDPFEFISVEDGTIGVTYTPKQIAHYKAYYGLDTSLPQQFFTYIKGLVRGDLGYSIYYKTKVSSLILSRIPWTLFIVSTSLLISCLLGTLLGSISAYKHNSLFDRIAYTTILSISEIPSFLIGTLLLIVLAARFQWFPLAGAATPFAQYTTLGNHVQDLLHHATLPILTLTITRTGSFYLLGRNSMLTIITKDFLRTAKAKGLSESRILFRHALRNALAPILSRFFLQLGAMFGGAILIENVFAYPGLGLLMREAVLTRDYLLMQGIFLVFSLIILLLNGFSDYVNHKLDPRNS